MGVPRERRRFPLHGWLGLLLVAVFWPLNWGLDGLRTHWGFFPMWLGYALAVDGLNVRRFGSSLATRDPRSYVGLFVVSVPLWWLFEAVNLRTRNWHYLGVESFSDVEYALLASLSFSTVVPAVLGTAERFAGTGWIQRFRHGPVVAASGRTPWRMLAVGVAMLVLLLARPTVFYPFCWLFLYLLIEAANLLTGRRSLFEATAEGDWRPVVALSVGVLCCGFFWEMWNWYSYPKWVYAVPGVGFWHVFEMPLLGYFGYLPFAFELFAAVHMALGLVGRPQSDWVMVGLRRSSPVDD